MIYTIKHTPNNEVSDWQVRDEDNCLVYRGDEREECQDWIALQELEAAE
jgi:hypothetical protein